jgi:hypothetical protein
VRRSTEFCLFFFLLFAFKLFLIRWRILFSH